MCNSINDKIMVHKVKFKNAKEKLKEFSEQAPTNMIIDKVETDKWFGLSKRNVTGEEINKLTNQVQKKLIALNEIQNKTIKEFNEIYNTFDWLDREYLNSIEISIEATRKINEELKCEQQKISETMKTQDETINTLIAFDEKYKKKFERLEKRLGGLSESIVLLNGSNEIMMRAVSECQKQANKNNKILIIAIMAIIGVLIEAIFILIKLNY